MKRWVMFISGRHFRTRRREKGHTASILSVGGIAAGVMTLVTVLAVMNGFQVGTIQDILEINSYHIQVEAADGRHSADRLRDLRGVDSAVPFVDFFALVQGFFSDPVAVAVRGLPADVLELDPGLGRQLEIVAGAFNTADELSIVIGEELARRLGIRVGETISLINFSADGLNLARPDSLDLVVTGLFKSGFLEYDAGWAFVSLNTAVVLGAGSPDTIGIKLADRYADRAASRRVLGELPGATVASWREYNRSIFGALRLEKTLMMLLVGLIFVVVGVNIFQSLRRSVTERTEEIAVLKALGASPRSLRFVFVLEGLWIGLAGSALGTTLGLLISTNVNAVFSGAELVVNFVLRAFSWLARLAGPSGAEASGGFTIFSPAYFYLDSVPATVLPGEVAGIALFALLSSVVAAVVASRRVSAIVPAEVLRYE